MSARRNDETHRRRSPWGGKGAGGRSWVAGVTRREACLPVSFASVARRREPPEAVHRRAAVDLAPSDGGPVERSSTPVLGGGVAGAGRRMLEQLARFGEAAAPERFEARPADRQHPERVAVAVEGAPARGLAGVEAEGGDPLHPD